MQRRLFALIAFSFMATMIGCSGSSDSSKTGTGSPTGKEGLEDLARMLKHFEDNKLKAPAKLNSLESVEPLFPAAYVGLAQGEIVYFWNNLLTPGGTAVLAHEKKVETTGGFVLLQDGTVKSMTAEEFKTAPSLAPKK